eukprot:scaffold1.g5195.t1
MAPCPITITTVDDQVFQLELDGGDAVATLKAILEAETGLVQVQQRLVHNGRDLAEGSTLAAAGVQPNDLIFLPDGSAAAPEALMAALAASPEQLAQLPIELANAVRRNDVAAFQSELRRWAGGGEYTLSGRRRSRRRRGSCGLPEEDPFNPEVQRKLEEAIQAKNVAENFEFALEHNPEAFSSVCMLYVNVEVNGFPIKAFVDSGAQMTIMSRSCAQRCNLLHLMDKRWQGMAVGVGQAKILGRIHMVQMKAGDAFFPVAITVLDQARLRRARRGVPVPCHTIAGEACGVPKGGLTLGMALALAGSQEGMDFLFGLENLKRHHCCIDLRDNVLRFGSSGAALPFLPEHEIPTKDRMDLMEADDGPASARAGAGSSAGAGGRQQGGAAALAPPTQQQAASPAPAAAAPRPTAAAPGGGGAPLPSGWEDKVQRLMALGFGREHVVQVLRATNGQEEVAANMLFNF